MSKKKTFTALALVLVLGVGVLAGCGSDELEKWSGNDDVPAGAAPLMPPSHEGRWEYGGTALCYGCHGAGTLGNPMLTGVTAIPDSHYEDSDSSTLTLDVGYAQCITCHAQGYDTED